MLPGQAPTILSPSSPATPTSGAQVTPRQASDVGRAWMEYYLGYGTFIPLNGGNTKERKGKK